MATFPPSIVPPGGGGAAPAAPGGAAPGAPGAAGSPMLKLAMLAQVIQGLSAQFPAADQGIKMMMDGLRQVQASVSAQSVPQQSAAPPR